MKDPYYRVAECFTSINGEAQAAGETAHFIRFCGCNLNCSYCDTRWANAPDVKPMLLTADALAKGAVSSGAQNVTLTGGEPLLQEEIGGLIELLGVMGFRVEIETNGSIPIGEFAALQHRPCFTLDYKLPGSGMESAMDTGNYQYLQMQDTVKFVSGSIEDLDRAREIITEYDLTAKCKVYLSPVFGKIEPAQMVEYMLRNRMAGVRMQLQMHKFIWDPEQRGV